MWVSFLVPLGVIYEGIGPVTAPASVLCWSVERWILLAGRLFELVATRTTFDQV